MSERWTLAFGELDKECTPEAGMKCANLGELTKIGIPVPPGFVVTARAFDSFLRDSNAHEEILEALSTFGGGDKAIGDIEKLSRNLSRIILGKEIPKKLQEAISQRYDILCETTHTLDVPVAVRSSGCAEDLPTAAFAGQYESYLNVRGLEELLDKVKDCWASLFTARVISYKLKNNLPIMDQLMGVIVQKLVHARCAGVAFTALPSTGNPSWIMIEGNWGMAESVVQGMVSPDKCYVSKETLQIEEKTAACKLRQCTLQEKGTMEEDIPSDKQSIFCFTDEEARRIAQAAKKIELHYGSPQDIEWAIERDLPFPDSVFFVQTRPITTLKKKSGADQVVDLMLSRYLKK